LTTNIDVLDRLLRRDILAGDRLFERVKVDADQVDRLDLLGREHFNMGRVGTPGEDRGMETGVEGLDPASEDLLLAGEFGNVGDLEPGFAQG
jgi:hypothetical protein